jgi:hypothetical protein
LAVGGWRLAVGGWRLAVGGWRLAVSGWRLGYQHYQKQFKTAVETKAEARSDRYEQWTKRFLPHYTDSLAVSLDLAQSRLRQGQLHRTEVSLILGAICAVIKSVYEDKQREIQIQVRKYFEAQGFRSLSSFVLKNPAAQFPGGHLPWCSARFLWARPESVRSFVVSLKKAMTAIDTNSRDFAIHWPVSSIFPKIDAMTDEFRLGPRSSSFEGAYQ